MIVEYMLQQVGDGSSMKTPSFVKDGGYWFDQDNFTYVGWVPPLVEREFYVPESIVTLSKESFISRALDIHSRYPMQDIEEEEPIVLTEEQVVERATDWWDYKTIEHLNSPSSISTTLVEDGVEIKVLFAKKGVVVTGDPYIIVTSGDSNITASLFAKSYNSLTFKALNVTEVVIPDNSSIALNGGTITNGETDLPIYLGDL